MINKGIRREGQPIFVNGDLTRKLERIPFIEKTFDENWIQTLIHKQPYILPVDEIESNFSPLIPIGREIPTVVGFIDNLFVSPNGYLTIVETKLWRNPEARREVVGQIIDYAKELKKWNYSDLDNVVKSYNQKYNSNSNGLIATIRNSEQLDESDEQFFIDLVSKNLERGRFLLLIVGDGIRESVEEMVEYLSQTPQLYFTLSLIELQVFCFDNVENSFIVIPQIVTRTKEITRAIIRIEGAKNADFNVKIDTDLVNENTSNNKTKRITLTEEDFLEQLLQNTNDKIVQFAKQILDDCKTRGYYIDWKQGSFVIKFIDPSGSGVKISLFVVERSNYIYIGWSSNQLEKIGLDKTISYSFAEDTAKLFKNVTVDPKYKHNWNEYVTLDELKTVYSKFIDRVDRFVDDIKKQIDEKAL